MQVFLMVKYSLFPKSWTHSKLLLVSATLKINGIFLLFYSSWSLVYFSWLFYSLFPALFLLLYYYINLGFLFYFSWVIILLLLVCYSTIFGFLFYSSWLIIQLLLVYNSIILGLLFHYSWLIILFLLGYFSIPLGLLFYSL